MPRPSAKPNTTFTSFAGLLGVVLLVLISYSPRLFSSSLDSQASLLRRDSSGDIIGSNATFASLSRRDDYSCGKGNPCANGACCGKAGYCGYGPEYCGTGCKSNCDAKAECGEFASPKGKTCPLNTCCSQYGFCGTTAEFCTMKCQSNCITNPKPPGGGGGGNVLKRVIGYYESWAQRLKCNKIDPTDLPLDALTHVNYAFAYIDPSTFNIVTMDTQTPESLFTSTANLKQYKQDLEVWISVGGWTFSDNGTKTQPVFGNIAASAANRQTFANNVLKFLNHYGFDGVDIDWEYPGAPDRGGKPRDTANFVSMLQTLRKTFDSSPRSLGITFTAPSSYWYLRWFDIPGLLKYADWVNFMTYDLHGVWDRNNPIGSIVQSHTNLTEINLALQLLWRVKTDPSRVSMGFGFYGRSFQLAKASCSKPGCQFTGGGSPGPCSGTSGILYYYEIQAMLKQHPELKPVYDQTAGAKYVVYNGNQWISYDDAQTLQQKVKFANAQGLGGSLIWASDTDDDKYTAHSGLLGKTIAHSDISQQPFGPTRGAIGRNLIGENGQDCKVLDQCVDKNSRASHCGNGQTRVGFVNDGTCKQPFLSFLYMKPICCPIRTAPKSCTWRGSGGDCNGQCHVGEANVLGGSYGGTPGESDPRQKCSRGYKVFCCDAGSWKQVTDGCYWTDCGAECKAGKEDVVATKNTGFLALCGQAYCCPKPAKLTNCRWKGSQPDCPDAKCDNGDVTIDLDPQGTTTFGCSWGRQKALCCSVRAPPVTPPRCQLSLCDVPGILCSEDSAAFKRDVDSYFPLEKRGKQRKFDLNAPFKGKTMFSRTYPSRSLLFGGDLIGMILRYFRQRRQRCDDTRVEEVPINLPNLPDQGQGETEHPIDLQLHARFIESIGLNLLPSGRPYPTAPPLPALIERIYLDPHFSMGAGLNPVSPTSPHGMGNPQQRVWEAMGSETNRAQLMLTERSINQAKNRLFRLFSPMDIGVYNNYVANAARGNANAQESFFAALRATVGVFAYLSLDEAADRYRNVRDSMRDQFAIIESEQPAMQGLSQRWLEFFSDYNQQVVNFAQEWVEDRIQTAERIYRAQAPPNLQAILQALQEIRDQKNDMELPK